MQKKFPMIQGWFVFVCVSVCVCVSVPSKKCCNFWTVGRIGAKFSGPTNLLASNFWVGDLDPAALGVRPVSAKSISSRGLGAGGSCKMLGAEFWNSAHGPRKRGQKAGLAWGPTKIWEFWHFFIKGTPAKIGHWSLSVWCNFLIQRNSRAPQVPHGPVGGGGHSGHFHEKLCAYQIQWCSIASRLLWRLLVNNECRWFLNKKLKFWGHVLSFSESGKWQV